MTGRSLFICLAVVSLHVALAPELTLSQSVQLLVYRWRTGAGGGVDSAEFVIRPDAYACEPWSRPTSTRLPSTS